MVASESCENNVTAAKCNGVKVIANEVSPNAATSSNVISQCDKEEKTKKKKKEKKKKKRRLMSDGSSNNEEKKAKLNQGSDSVEDSLISNYTNAFPQGMDERTILRLKEMLRLVNLRKLQSIEEEKNSCKNEKNNHLGAGELSRKRLRSTTREQVPEASSSYPWYAISKKGCDFFSLVCKDISLGQEDKSIPVINECDVPPFAPDSFTYIKSMQVSDNVKVPSRADGCRCKGSCSMTKTCSCINLNGSAPYNPQNGGRLIKASDVVFECGPKCGCGPDCGNRVSQSGIKYKLQVFRMPDKGWAVRTLEKIPEGAPVCEYIGVLRRSDEVENDINNSYFFEIDCKQTINELEGRERRFCHVPLPMSSSVDDVTTETEPEFCIDAGTSGNVARFINHSCEPNLFVQCVLSDHHDIRLARLVLFASTEICPYQELTYDYGYQLDSVIGPDGNIKQMPCHCGEANCRKRLY